MKWLQEYIPTFSAVSFDIERFLSHEMASADNDSLFTRLGVGRFLSA
jgi:hypothetical protein